MLKNINKRQTKCKKKKSDLESSNFKTVMRKDDEDHNKRKEKENLTQ